MTQTQQKSLISIVFILLIAGLIVSLNVDNQDTQSSVSVITPSNTNTSSVDNPAQVTPSNNTNTNTNTQANTKQTQDPFNPNNNSNQASSEALNNDPRLPPGFPKSLPPLDKDEIKQTDALIAKADDIIAKMDTLIAELDLPKTKLSEAEQAQLNTQRQIQQDRLDDIKAQIEALE